MVAVAVTLGFFIGGGPALLAEGSGDATGVITSPSSSSSSTTTTTTGLDAATTTTTTAGEATTTTAPPARAPGEVSVKVYNGSTTAGQAVRVGDRLKAAGYRVLAPGPSPGDPRPASVVHFVDGFAAEAAALAVTLGLPATAAAPMPSAPPVRDVGAAQLVLIVADDLVLSP